MGENVEKQDSFTIGTSGKGGASKVYYDLSTMELSEIEELVKKAIKIWRLSTTLTQ